MNRGFVYSLDSLLAFFVIFFLLLLCFLQISQVSWSNSSYDHSLVSFTQSAITSGQKSGLFTHVLSDHQPLLLQSFIDKFPSTICARLSLDQVNSSDDVLELVVEKGNCSIESKEVFSTQRLIPVQTSTGFQFYQATLTTWRNIS